MNNFILLLFLLSISLTSLAQSTFSLIIDSEPLIDNNDYAAAIVANEDGIMLGIVDGGQGGSKIDFFKTDLDGNVQWINQFEEDPERTYSLGSLIRTLDGNYAINSGKNVAVGTDIGLAESGILLIDSLGDFVKFNELITLSNGTVQHGLI